MKGIVYRSTGSWYFIKDETGKFWNGRMKGIFKIDDITSTNPVAVGDGVEIEREGDDNVTIVQILDRKNYINRQSPRAKHQQHIIAANLDQSILLATLREPRTSQGFIDRFVVASEMYHIPSLIVFNKADLYRKKEEQQFDRMSQMYRKIGYKVFLSSVQNGEGVDEIKSQLQNKVTLISGHSGVGKSSLLNVIQPDLILKTQEVSGWSGKGLHTTTFAEMFDLPDGGKLIDTPGMREFGLVNVSKQELSHYFPEMRELLVNCQFNNCLHFNEPGCAIKEAVVAEVIDEDRYISYLTILDSIDDKNY